MQYKLIHYVLHRKHNYFIPLYHYDTLIRIQPDLTNMLNTTGYMKC